MRGREAFRKLNTDSYRVCAKERERSLLHTVVSEDCNS